MVAAAGPGMVGVDSSSLPVLRRCSGEFTVAKRAMGTGKRSRRVRGRRGGG